jgi:hypothetical protein
MKRVKADDYFSNGLFELARFGRHTLIKNTMTPRQHKEYIKTIKSQYIDLKDEINDKVHSLRNKVIHCDPLAILLFSVDMRLLGALGKQSEIQYDREDISISRITEYIQSILVSSPSKYEKNEKYDPTEAFVSIQKDIMELYNLIDNFYLSWATSLEDIYPDWGPEIIQMAAESQMLYQVRGQRYQVFEIEYFDKLLYIHNDIFQKQFNMNISEIIEGIQALQYSITQGKVDSLEKMKILIDKISDLDNINSKDFKEKYGKESAIIANEMFGPKLFDVREVTNWNQRFVKELSYSINEEDKFFTDYEFAGWPVIDLPIQKRPFIELNNNYYCFDYYSFMDNFYRVIQKMITRLDPNYSWSDKQQIASETMVESIFKQILPGCLTYSENYYPIDKSIKNLAENDLLVLYNDVLIVVEVKAGSFVYTPPLTDFEAHMISYKSLIEKADWQCKRTYDYLIRNEISILYDRERNIKKKINMEEIRDIYMMSVTVDNINDFAARAEKLSFLELKCNAISVSVDDLMVYREYFSSPLLFLHFLKQRRAATQEEKLALNDELDHLGMYIFHNCYYYQTDLASKNTRLNFYGYREELDKYFCSLYHPQLKSKKPTQNIPDLFLRIIKYLESEDKSNKVEISNYLLDFSSESREELCNHIEYGIDRQKKIKRMILLAGAGAGDSLRYTCFINQPNITPLTKEEKRESVLASLIWNEEEDRILLDMYFDEKDQFYKLIYKKYTEEDILEDEMEKLRSKGEQIADLRLKKYKSIYGKRIGRNQLCPCASGKKYKRCCGR